MSKIICERIECRNFFSYGNSWTEMDLHSGVNAIIGYDEDKDRSMGSGKTSILSVIPFALFGKPMKDVSLDKIINWKNGKQCEVRFHFTKDGIKYMVHRGIKPSILSLTKDGIPQPLLSDKRAFQQEIENDLIGMDFKSAQMINFQNANNLISMFTAKKEEKRKFIEKFFNLEMYTKLNELVNKKLGVISEKMSEYTRDIDTKQKRINELQHEIDNQVTIDISHDESRLSDIQSELSQLPKIIEINNEISQLKLELSNIQTLKVEIQAEYEKFKNEVTKNKSAIALQKSTLDSYNKRIEKIGDISEQKETVNKINEVLSKLSNLDTEIERIDELYTTEQNKISTITVHIKNWESELKKLKVDYDKWTNIKVLDSIECPTCFQTVNSEHMEEHIKGYISSITDQMDELKALITEYNKKYDENRIVVNELNIKRIELKERKDKKTKLEIRLASYSDLESKELELVELSKSIDKCNTAILLHERELLEKYNDGEANIFSSRIYECSTKENDIRSSISEKELLINKIKSLEAQYELLLDSINKQKGIIKSIELERDIKIASVAQLQKEIKAIDTHIKKNNTLSDYLLYVKETLKDENAKQYAISNIVPFINTQTNHYLSETGHNYYVKLDNWLDGQILGAGVGECAFENMSGGEGKIIDLSMKFAMMDVARRQAGSYLDILVLDELLDSSVDSQGIDNLMNIVKLKQKEDDLKVFIVSHREEVSEYGFDKIYQVHKKNGFSNISLL